MTPFAAYIPVGPDQGEITRTVDLIDSLCAYEPMVSWIVIVDDSHTYRNLEQYIKVPSSCKLHILPHPRKGDNANILGGLCAANLVAFSHIERRTNSEFVLKLDTDALVIAPFAQKVKSKFELEPRAGIVGLLGDSCNRAVCSHSCDKLVVEMLHRARDIARYSDANISDVKSKIGILQNKTDGQARRFIELCEQISMISAADFNGEHCQGGAYAVSSKLINRLFKRGLLEDPLFWLDVPFGEDRMMAGQSPYKGVSFITLQALD